jgi:hypothetical protein
MDVRAGRYYTLDEVASRIWTLAADGLPTTDIVQAVIAEYDVDADAAAADVSNFIAQMCKQKLMVAA